MSVDLDYQLISSDDHIVEPPNVWEGRLESKFQERAPRIVDVDGTEHWVFEDRQLMNIGLAVMAGKKYEQYSPKAVRFEDMLRGCYDPKARLEDMDRDGIAGRGAVSLDTRYGGRHLSARPAIPSSDCAACRPTTTGWRTPGARPTPSASSARRSSPSGIYPPPSRSSSAG